MKIRLDCVLLLCMSSAAKCCSQKKILVKSVSCTARLMWHNMFSRENANSFSSVLFCLQPRQQRRRRVYFKEKSYVKLPESQGLKQPLFHQPMTMPKLPFHAKILKRRLKRILYCRKNAIVVRGQKFHEKDIMH